MSKNLAKISFNNYYAFILGREQKIALFELESVLRRFSFYFDKNYPERVQSNEDESKGGNYSVLSLQDNVVIIKTEKASSFQLLAVRLMENLGGTVKIYEITNNQKPIINKISNNQYQIVQSQIVDKLLENKSNGTLNFGISDYSNTFSERELKKLGIEIKKEARRKRPVRFVEGKGTELSSATSYHKIYKTGGEEFGIFRITNNQETIINKMTNIQYPISNEISNSKTKECHSELVEESQNRVGGEKYGSGQKNTEDYSLHPTCYLLGRLVATTNPDEWSERDYGKPAGDKYSGMMPPKLARMMVNIALGEAITNNQEAITNEINNNQYPTTDEPRNRRTEEQKKECHSERSDNGVEESHHRASGSINNGENSEFRIKDSANQISGQKNKKTEEQRNIENSDIEHSLKIENLHNVVVLDPFCGSGNILMEAVLLGCNIIGSDISEKAVEDTRANLRWLISNNQETITSKIFNIQYPPKGPLNPGAITNEITNSKMIECHSERSNNGVEESHHRVSGSRSSFIGHNNLTIQQFNNNCIFKADATMYDFASKLSTLNFDLSTRDIVIVAEPYLGKPKKIKDQKSKIKDEIKELKSLYLSFFNNLKLLSAHYSLLAITFVFPVIETLDAGEISLYNECVDELRQMGYNTTRTLRYGRDYQIVKREIVLLTKE